MATEGAEISFSEHLQSRKLQVQQSINALHQMMEGIIFLRAGNRATTYAVAGWNGLAAMSSWEGAQKIQKYIKRASVTSFDTFEEAEHWAILVFSQRVPPEYQVVAERKLDRAVFGKQLWPDFI